MKGFELKRKLGSSTRNLKYDDDDDDDDNNNNNNNNNNNEHCTLH